MWELAIFGQTSPRILSVEIDADASASGTISVLDEDTLIKTKDCRREPSTQTGGSPSTTESALLQEITQLHSEVLGAAKVSLEKAIHIGQLLSELKKKAGHGNWLLSVQKFPFCEKTAGNYLRLYRDRDRFKTANVADLGLAAAYRALTKPGKQSPATQTLNQNRASGGSEPPASTITPLKGSAPSGKAELITRITRNLSAGLELLSEEQLQRFGTDLAGFKESWIHKNAPENAISQPVNRRLQIV